jgi:hypothetical protein
MRFGLAKHSPTVRHGRNESAETDEGFKGWVTALCRVSFPVKNFSISADVTTVPGGLKKWKFF